jgi:hypothetical protein
MGDLGKNETLFYHNTCILLMQPGERDLTEKYLLTIVTVVPTTAWLCLYGLA